MYSLSYGSPRRRINTEKIKIKINTNLEETFQPWIFRGLVQKPLKENRPELNWICPIPTFVDISSHDG